MKYVYTPRKYKSINVQVNREVYNCDAYDMFREKRKDDLLAIVTEINRREEDKYHLPKV